MKNLVFAAALLAVVSMVPGSASAGDFGYGYGYSYGRVGHCYLGQCYVPYRSPYATPGRYDVPRRRTIYNHPRFDTRRQANRRPVTRHDPTRHRAFYGGEKIQSRGYYDNVRRHTGSYGGRVNTYRHRGTSRSETRTRQYQAFRGGRF